MHVERYDLDDPRLSLISTARRSDIDTHVLRISVLSGLDVAKAPRILGDTDPEFLVVAMVQHC
jgi:hypothetical protein